MRAKLACVLLVVALGACNGKSAPAETRVAPDGKGSGASGPAAPAARATLTGKVLETANADDRTYLRIEWSGRERWVAVPTATVKVGDVVTISDASEMKTFTSKTLNRTFEHILLGQLGPAPASGPAGTALPPGHPPIPATQPEHPAVAPPAKIGDVKVPKATGANAQTVAGVFADSAKLKDKPVVVNGVVVKVNTAIMGKNWVHLQDGTGSAAKQDNDLVFTTADTVKVGDKVRASGAVHKDKDFGFGYKYATIVEDAKLEPLK
jgi:hypothetical protein